MIITETQTIEGKQYTYTYSDINHYIRQDGTNAIYANALDPADSGRTYTETDDIIPEEPAPDEDYIQAAKILLGEEQA